MVALIMLVVGIGTLKVVDFQSGQGAVERARESSFNTTEGLLYAESAVLQKAWPKTPTQAYVSSCNNANFTSNTGQCPNASELIGTTPDFGGSALAEFPTSTTPKVGALGPRAFYTGTAAAAHEAQGEDLPGPAFDATIEVLEEIREQATTGPRRKDAKVIISGGRGMQAEHRRRHSAHLNGRVARFDVRENGSRCRLDIGVSTVLRDGPHDRCVLLACLLVCQAEGRFLSGQSVDLVHPLLELVGEESQDHQQDHVGNTDAHPPSRSPSPGLCKTCNWRYSPRRSGAATTAATTGCHGSWPVPKR